MIIVVKMETEVLVLTGSILGRVDGVECERFFLTTARSYSLRVLPLLIVNRCEWKLRS